jgi:phenylacetate-CoA ligase
MVEFRENRGVPDATGQCADRTCCTDRSLFLPDILAANHGVMDWDNWRQIPILERTDIQQNRDALISGNIPPSHLPISSGKTSGSTGRPIELIKTNVTGLMWCALTLRGHLWHRRDLTAKLATIKAFPQELPDEGVELQSWGPSTEMYANKGKAVVFNVHLPVKRQLAWLQRQNPDYLISYPSNLAALAEESLQQRLELPALREVISMGEKLTQQQHQLCREAWGVEIKDIYSADEIGYIAHQSPTGEGYLVQAEHVIVEVLDTDGEPCKPGEAGRVVITTLNNFAMPLIRYAIGDYAVVGEPSACGRGLSVLSEILGRRRNMIVLPDGGRYWPLAGYNHYEEIARVLQYQLVQLDTECIEVRLVVAETLTHEQEMRLTTVIQTALLHPFKLKFKYFENEIPKSSGGKFEDFISLVR